VRNDFALNGWTGWEQLTIMPARGWLAPLRSACPPLPENRIKKKRRKIKPDGRWDVYGHAG